MLTDEEAARIHAVHEALPGTPPDGYSWAYRRDVPVVNDWIGERKAQWRDVQLMRLTFREEDETLWLEFWKERPEKAAPFNPPYTATPLGKSAEQP